MEWSTTSDANLSCRYFPFIFPIAASSSAAAADKPPQLGGRELGSAAASPRAPAAAASPRAPAASAGRERARAAVSPCAPVAAAASPRLVLLPLPCRRPRPRRLVLLPPSCRRSRLRRLVLPLPRPGDLLPTTPPALALPETREVRERKGREEGKERVADLDKLTGGAHAGPTLTQKPRSIKPGSKPPKDLGKEGGGGGGGERGPHQYPVAAEPGNGCQWELNTLADTTRRANGIHLEKHHQKATMVMAMGKGRRGGGRFAMRFPIAHALDSCR
uniref:Uncharacterized protein n=1 Tax=Oryza nivara TaxID=4536 RepID=A0A0E0IWW4_ORYNI